MATVIRGARIVGPSDVYDGDIRIENGRIAAIGNASGASGAEVIDASGLHALPGFIDLHVHGGLGFDLNSGLYDVRRKEFDNSTAAYRKAIPRLMKRFAQRGVTRTLLATLASPIEELEYALGHLADYVEGESNGVDGARLMGGFIEGTFIMRPEHAGAQNPKNFRFPGVHVFEQLNRAARGNIRYMNVVPEYGAPAERLIRHLAKEGVLVGMGHSGCGADQVLKCVKLGLRVAIHFLNGPTGVSYKPFHGGNVKEAVLRCNDMYAELIGDGWHVAPPYVVDIIRRKGYNRVAAVTDAVFAAGASGIKNFTLGGVEGVKHRSGQYVHTKSNPMTLFGSLLDMSTAFGNFLSWLTDSVEGIWHPRQPGLDLDRALVRVARMCSRNAARLIDADHSKGRNAPAGGVGKIEEGRCADIVLAGISGEQGDYKLDVKHTFVEGRMVV